MTKNIFKTVWETCLPNAKSAGDRPWGEEIILATGAGELIMKKLIIKAGSKGGLQYHRKRVEAGYIVSGKMIIRIGVNGNIEEKVLSAGEHFIFNKGVIHQEEALEDTIIIECSNPWLNDRVRVESDFGINDISGLPSTNPGDEIKI